MQRSDTPIGSLPPTPSGHFVLSLYSAVFDLLLYIRNLSTMSGEGFHSVLQKQTFLRGYLSEIQLALPQVDPWSVGTEHWSTTRKAFETHCTVRLPLVALVAEGGLTEPALRLLMLLGLVEEDSRFGDLFAWLQPGSVSRRPTLELAERIVEEASDRWPLDGEPAWRALVRAGLVEPVNREAPRAEWTLRTPPELWAVIRGEAECQPPLGRLALSQPRQLNLPEAVRARLEQATALLATGERRLVSLRTDPGADIENVAASLLSGAGRTPLLIEGQPENAAARLLGPWCTMTGTAPVFLHELGPGETVAPPDLPGYSGPAILALGEDGGLTPHGSEPAVTLHLPPLGPELRREAWRGALGDAIEPTDMAVLENYRISEGFVRRIARAALAEANLDGRESVSAEDVRSAARALNHQLLDGLADRLAPITGWDRLIAAPSTRAMLAELECFALGRERLAGDLGAGFGPTGPQGVRALFTGVSGTGKTMAAQILADALGKDLYRVDLAAVVNKYIGETEKNLNRVLSRAEALDVVLLLDEGDALLGARTEVKSANDRYANLETNYLLQRLEHFRGIVVVTTNYGENVDKAFQRRMDVVVPFFPPSAVERRAILELHLPPNHAIDAEALADAAARCELTGGQLRNVALRAAFSATKADSGLDAGHLMRALAVEHDKAGAVFPLGGWTSTGARSGKSSLGTFLGALKASR